MRDERQAASGKRVNGTGYHVPLAPRPSPFAQNQRKQVWTPQR